MLNAVKYGALGVVGGTAAAAVVSSQKNQTAEHIANGFSTATNLGALAATPFLASAAAKISPRKYCKVAQKSGNWIEKGIEYLKNTELGKYVVNKIKSASTNPKLNKTIQNAASTITKKLKEFTNLSTVKKGKIGLITAGVSLLALAGIKTITHYYKKEGAIDQKYKDMEVMNKILI